MNSIEKLTQIFSQFPGIGPRQAKRFVYYLLTRNRENLDELVENIKDLKNDVFVCNDCKRFYEKKNQNSNLCKICSDQNRDRGTLMLVQRDIDLDSIEKSKNFNGIYFVLGGSIPILEKEPEKRIRVKELLKFIKQQIASPNQIKEIILGTNWNPEGENTAIYIKKEIENFLKESGVQIKISHLGKGLSMGTEIEYTDSDTLKNALKNRG